MDPFTNSTIVITSLFDGLFVFSMISKSNLPVFQFPDRNSVVFLSVQGRRRLRKFARWYFSTHHLSCLTSIENIFTSASDAASFKQIQFALGSESDISHLYKKRCS